jgi:hypothetical protein
LDKRDRLINLLPEEYLPEPEFKAFPIFAAVLVILTILYIYFQYKNDDRLVRQAREELAQVTARVEEQKVEALDFMSVQANARFIRSYLAIIPRVVMEAPDYWEIYNDIERNLPEDTWVTSVAFRGGRGPFPGLTVNFLSRGYSFNGPLLTYDSLKGSREHPTRFKNLRMGGYQRTMLGGIPAAQFTIIMDVRLPNEPGLYEE